MNSGKLTKRILILTLEPLGLNYGGTVQAYALQVALKRMGYKTATHDEKNTLGLRLKGVIDVIKYFISNNTIRRNRGIKRYHIPKSILTKHTSLFVDNHINTDTLKLDKGAAAIMDKYDAVIVGSDQVWRKDYADISKYLLDFTGNMNITRISYAASFGKDDISGYGDDLLLTSKRLAKTFDAVSVREDSAIGICKKYWDVDAVQVLDPTMLLTKEDYIQLIEQDEIVSAKGNNIFSYVLDENDLTKKIHSIVEEQLGLTLYRITPAPPKSYKELLKNPDTYAWPSISLWLRGFYDAEFVVTDSFHGTVFSIIFNKPFIAIGNKDRGMSRFLSLLKIFGLESRLISDDLETIPKLLNEQIDWARVNATRRKEQQRSLDYLSKNLGSSSDKG